MSKHLNQPPARTPKPGPTPLSRRDAMRRVAAGGLALGAAMALGRRPARAQGEPDPAATEAAARHAIGVINQALASGEMSLLEAVFAPSYVTHTPHRSRTTGQLVRPDRTGLTASLSELRDAVPDAVLIIEDVIAAAEMAAVRVRFQGTLAPAGDGGTPAASQRLDLGGVVVVRIADGLVAESWDYAEATELLGASPAAGPALAPAAATAAPAEAAAEAGRGEVRAVSGFDAVSLDGVGTLVLTQGDTETLTIEAEPHVLARIETLVEAGTLFIRPDDSFETDQPIVYHLSLRQLTRLAVAGAAQVTADALTAAVLRLDLSGSAVVVIDGLVVTALDLVAGGTAQIELAGTTEQQTVLLSAASSYTAPNLASRVATVTVEAAAHATVAVSEQLEAQISGAGSIGYLGDPQVSQQVSGAGSLLKLG